MLKILIIGVVVIAAIVAVVLAYAAMQPDQFQVQRSTRIKASANKIFPLIDDLHAFNTWNPFDKKDPNILHDVITVFDHALTRPWTADKTYRRRNEKYPNWDRVSCLEGTTYVTIGKEYYMVTADGYLMPTTKGQQPPDPKYFPQAKK